MHTDNKNKIIKRNLRLSAKICVLNKGYNSKLRGKQVRKVGSLQASKLSSFQASGPMNYELILASLKRRENYDERKRPKP
jgi:hypothetical protein